MMSFIVLSFSLLARVLKEPFSRVQCATSSRICRGLRREHCELAFERLAYTCAPTLGDGQRRGIGKDILFAFLQPIEDVPSPRVGAQVRSEEHTSELQSHSDLVCRL